VSIAPQNELPSHRLAISASTPVPVVESLTWPSSWLSVCTVVPGNTSRRSPSTLVSIEWLDSTWPATNRPSSATGMIPSSML
jgi:hypothetical protein